MLLSLQIVITRLRLQAIEKYQYGMLQQQLREKLQQEEGEEEELYEQTRKKRILLVDDEPDHCMVYQIVLEHAGYECIPPYTDSIKVLQEFKIVVEYEGIYATPDLKRQGPNISPSDFLIVELKNNSSGKRLTIEDSTFQSYVIQTLYYLCICHIETAVINIVYNTAEFAWYKRDKLEITI
jgi:Tfp pilus assembly protein PilO